MHYLNHKPSNDENFYVAFVNVQVTSIDEKQVFLIDPVFTPYRSFLGFEITYLIIYLLRHPCFFERLC